MLYRRKCKKTVEKCKKIVVLNGPSYKTTNKTEQKQLHHGDKAVAAVGHKWNITRKPPSRTCCHRPLLPFYRRRNGCIRHRSHVYIGKLTFSFPSLMEEQSLPFIAGYCFIAAVVDVLETPKRIVNNILRTNQHLTVPYHD